MSWDLLLDSVGCDSGEHLLALMSYWAPKLVDTNTDAHIYMHTDTHNT